MAEPEAALMAFGFNQLESTVYCSLLRESPATGYRLAQRVGRVPANVYQALKALVQKGAILVESDAADATSYVPVPPEQLFATLRSAFARRSNDALDALRTVNRAPTRETLSQLGTTSQVLERARSMLDSATETILFDAVPDLYDLLRPHFDQARERGVLVGGIAYRPEDADETMPFKGEPAGEVTRRWPGLGLILVSDACQQLVAQISRDMTGVLNAVYSDSAFLSCLLHGLLQADIRVEALRVSIGTPLPPTGLDRLALQAAAPPGLRALLGA